MDELRRLAALGLPLSFVPVARAEPPADHANALLQPGLLRLGGAVRHPATLGRDSLRTAGALRNLGDIALTKPGAEVKPTLTGYRGILLTDLLDSVGIDAPNHKHLKRIFIVARARDDYAVVFSWSELFNSQVGAGVYVLLEKDGAAISESEGPVVLVSAKDTFTGPRHVRWLASIDVLSA